jgi:predicted GIY-YIG superfamily endonuclease
MTTTVYRAYDAEETLLYVGCTDKPQRRRRQHESKSEWYRDAVRWTFEEYQTREAGLAAESAAIVAEHPIYNISGADRSACDHPRCVRRRAEEKARIADHIRQVVETAPRLTSEQIERLRALLPKPVTSGEIGDAPDAAA